MGLISQLAAMIPAPILLALVGVGVVCIVTLVTWSFYEGREISFWPPKIGPRPTAAEREKSRQHNPPQITQNDVVRGDVAPPSYPASGKHSSTPPHNRFPERLIHVSRLNNTDHSVIDIYRDAEKQVVVKTTLASLCDIDSLRTVAHLGFDPIDGWDTQVRRFLSGPREVWTADDRVSELYDFVDGVSLGKLVSRERRVGNHTIDRCTNMLIELMSHLEASGLTHRDISPFNVLLSATFDLKLVDWTFCCKAGRRLTSAITKGFTAPEIDGLEKQSTASHLSDWYSVGATLYFLANGSPPPSGPERVSRMADFENGLARIYERGNQTVQFDLGTKWSSGLSNFCRALLVENPLERIIPRNIYWEARTVQPGEVRFTAPRGLQAGDRCLVIVTDEHMWLLPHDLPHLTNLLARVPNTEIETILSNYKGVV